MLFVKINNVIMNLEKIREVVYKPVDGNTHEEVDIFTEPGTATQIFRDSEAAVFWAFMCDIQSSLERHCILVDLDRKISQHQLVNPSKKK